MTKNDEIANYVRSLIDDMDEKDDNYKMTFNCLIGYISIIDVKESKNDTRNII